MVFQVGGEVEQQKTVKPFQQGGEVASQQQDQPTSEQLIEQLGGELPLPEGQPLPRAARTPSQLGIGGVRFETIQKRNTFNELLNRGFTRQQLEQTFQAQKVLGGLRVGRTAGGIFGAIGTTALAGRFIPGPIDDAGILIALLASAGAGTGGIAGEAAQTAIEEKRLISSREALHAFAIEGGTELGGRGVLHAGKFALSPFIKKTIPEAAALVDDFAKVGGTFSPTELDRRFSLNIWESFSRGSFGAKQIYQEFEEQQGRAVLAFSDNILEAISEGVARQTPKEIGETFAEGITRPGGRIFSMLDELFDPLYKQIDNIALEEAQFGLRQIKTGGKVIRGKAGKFQAARQIQSTRLKPRLSTEPLKRFAKKELAKDARIKHLSPLGRSKLKETLDLPEFFTFSETRAKRAAFLKDARKLGRDLDQSESIIAELATVTDSMILNPKASKGLGQKTIRLLDNTNALYAKAKEGLTTTFSEKVAKRLIKNPSSIVKELFPNNSPKSIKILRKSLVEPISGKPSAEGKVLWNQLRQAWLADAIDEATKTGVVKPRVFDEILRKAKGSLKEMYPDDIQQVRRIQQLMNLAGKGPPAGTSLFSRSAQIAGLAMMYKGSKDGDFIGFTAGGVLAVGPLAFAKLATNPKGVKFLTAGLKLKPGAKGTVPNAIRMVRLLREINRKENEPTRKKLKKQQRKSQLQRQLQLSRGIGLSPSVQGAAQQLTGTTP